METAKLGWVIVYVPDVEEAVAFYERAFGLSRTFVDPAGQFGQLDTGSTALAFASDDLGATNVPQGVRRPGREEPTASMELAFVFDDVPAAFAHAVDQGCTALSAPEEKPHGQTVGWVRDPWSTLIEIASPLG